MSSASASACEVFDASTTTPHLQYAKSIDEGARGIFLVAQLTDRWGVRYTPDGKIIWTEKSLPADYRGPVPRELTSKR